MPAVALAWAMRFQRFTAADLGLNARGLARSVALGVVAAAAISLPAALYFLYPIGVGGGSIHYDEVAGDSVGDLLYWALVRYPLNAALFEEVLFRGVLQALALR